MRKPKHRLEKTLQSLLESRVEKFFTPLENFIYKQTTAALFLLVATIAALILANSPWNDITQAIAHFEAGTVFHHWQFLLPLKEWVSSGLMALFFFLIGLELKREILAGRLRNPQQISLIIMDAIGGMVLPAFDILVLQSWNTWRTRMGNSHGHRHGVCYRRSRASRQKSILWLFYFFNGNGYL